VDVKHAATHTVIPLLVTVCLSAARELAPGGEVHGEQTYPFEFTNVDATMDSYRGASARLRYVLKVTVSKSVGGFSQEFPLWVQNPCTSPHPDEPIKVCARLS
jgi:Vacuolar protein sorting-associated protein 26